MHDIMIDVETFGTGPTAAIVQIGAVLFDSRSSAPVGTKFQHNVSLQSSLLAGATMDADTLSWWHEQEHPTHTLGQAFPLEDALRGLSKWWPNELDVMVWSHGAAFDVPVLEHSYRLCKIKPPWHYRNVRDTRTLFDLATSLGWQKPQASTAHDGLQDAIDQALLVQQAMRQVLRP